ncbi:hypothetical protein [Arthrobacter oryzae]|uniref:hypothetical protein n=1 Tax=Arthrobacter oryzae TaxID=409290 RepID=UPI00285BCC05|nr:hypothetical protein [Arthrobacter oryzae]MDR6507611.1 hypothetical protein [Arthrobacter oryzae]
MPDDPLELVVELLCVAVGVALFLYGPDLSIFPAGKNDNDAITLIDSSVPVMFDDRH